MRTSRSRPACVFAPALTALLLAGGCGPFFDWLTSLSQGPAGAAVPAETGVTLQIENQSGIAAAVDVVYWTEAGSLVRETTRALAATGPASTEIVLPTRAHRIHVLATAAEAASGSAGQQVQEGAVLAEADYQRGIDFETNGTVRFTIPAPNTPPQIVDCNENGITDARDIATGFSTDCDGNLIPDECDVASDPALDCDGNGTLDACDLQANPAIDCDNNGSIDACEWLDCDGNGRHDPCDILNCRGDPSCDDCNSNGIPDGCDIHSGTSSDQDANGIPDECQLPAILFVDDDAPPGGDGFSWATAFNDLQDALGTAAGAPSQIQQIWVAAGVYRPDRGSGDRSKGFDMPPDVALYGGLAGDEDPDGFDLATRDFEAHETILSGEIGSTSGAGDESFHVVTANGVGPFSILDGFTIAYGFAADAATGNDGGGLYVETASPSIWNCTFESNVASAGGAVALFDASQPLFAACAFVDNAAGLDLGGAGGAVYVGVNCDAVFFACTFEGNQAYDGGGIFAASDAVIAALECGFVDNMATNAGGGACMSGSVNSQFVACLFSNNDALRGGGVCNFFGAPFLQSCTFDGNSATESGGGLQDNTGLSIVIESVFSSNSAQSGGGIACCQGSLTTIVLSLIDGNDAALSAGGVYGSSSDPWLWASAMVGNTTEGSGGGADFDGGNPLLVECAVYDNAALSNGGGISLRGGSASAIVNCLVSQNEAGVLGGGLSMEACGTTAGVANAIVSGNHALSGGALSLSTGAAASLVNSTIWANSAEDGAGAVQQGGAAASLTNCIVWNNTESPISGTVWVQYSDVEGGFPGTGNIDDAPIFADAQGEDETPGTLDDDLRLAAGSPCIDAGDNDALPADVADLDVDGDSGEPIPVDFVWTERRLNDPATEDSGNAGQAGPPVVDMGAFEHVSLVGACCISGWCEIETQALCSTYDGTYLGDGTDCDPNPCEAPEACCLTMGECTMALPSDCFDAGGEPQGYNSSCYPDPCSVLEGACCLPQYGCVFVSEIDCDEMDGTYLGDGSACDPDPCSPSDPCQYDPCYAPSCPGWDPCLCIGPCDPACPDFCVFYVCPRTDANQNGINDDCEPPPYRSADRAPPLSCAETPAG